ncbi:MAG: hypothetical protein BMS9Abin10_0476 [Gammaproteobacteria bacterium]|nr:MAG: hypothetical protein BMS9Abin10_0476 [Gammaproteobacteria bacterium]
MTLGVLLAGPLLMVACGKIDLAQDWRTADRSAAGIAPDPGSTREAVVQVYAARAMSWRGIFAVHTWIATKPQGADRYTVHQVVGWRKWHNLPVVISAPDIPDRAWFGNLPEIVAELRGDAAARAIPRIEAAVRGYPYAREYVLWPGPNSNTFTAYIGRKVPELALDLPTTAIGKDFLADGNLANRAPSGSGVQLSLYGVLGILVARQEGLEFNLLGLSFGIDLLRPALKLPGVGRLGMRKPMIAEP